MASQRSERETQQRRAIRSVIQRIGRPMSPREVLDSALPQSPGLGIATVYRTLRNGVETGWLTPVELPGEPPRYESRVDGQTPPPPLPLPELRPRL
jgi:Fur family ferric uptake transcriptional regulator